MPVITGLILETLRSLPFTTDNRQAKTSVPSGVGIGNQLQPHQVNLADDPRYATERTELEALLLAEQKRLQDSHRLWDQTQE